MSDEPELLLRYLDAQRGHVLKALDGLTDDQLRQPILPSGWHCLGLVKHLTLADERYWFRSIVGGEALDYFPEEPGGDWSVGAEVSTTEIIDAYRDEIALANELIRATPLDAAPRQRDPLWEEWGEDFPDLRYIMLHMITETAVHAGHLDAVRELIDGRLFIVV